MPAHVFVVDEINYDICTCKGIAGLTEGATPKIHQELLSRMAIIKSGDYVLFYVTGTKELRGVWKASGRPFFDETPVWENKTYPFRLRIESTEFSFKNSLRLNDVNDLRNHGKIWTWSLFRRNATNAMFSISNSEYDILFQEYLKINPFSIEESIVREPYRVIQPNLVKQLAYQRNGLPYEASVMAMLHWSFVENEFQGIFGNYTDYISYVPTNLGTEIDVLLSFGNPKNAEQIMSYDVIEVKADRFDSKGLRQLIGYESWFIHKKVHGDMNMIRVTAIAKRFDDDVIDYVQKRKIFEGKEIKLFQYDVSDDRKLMLKTMIE